MIRQTSHTEKQVQFLLTDEKGVSTVLFEFDFDSSDEPMDRLVTDDSYFGLSEMPQYVGKSEAFRGLDVRIQLWDQAIQFTFGQDIDAASFASATTPTTVRLMEDHRIVQAYFDEVGIASNVQALVENGAPWKLWLSNKALEPAPADAALFDDLKLTASGVATNKDLRTLTIVSGHGVSTPPGRINPFEPGTVVTCKVESVISGNNLLIPTGWVLSGNEPASGNTNEFIMTLANDAVLTWQWRTNALVSSISVTTNAVADTYVQDGNPATFGSDSVIRISDHSAEQGFLKFVVGGDLDWDFVDSIMLRVRAAGNITNTTIYAVEDAGWQEGTISGLNEPAMGAMLDTVSTIAAGDWHEFNVSDYITSNGIWSIGMKELDGSRVLLANGDFELPDLANSAPLSDGGWSDLTSASHVIHAAGWAAETGDQGVWLKGWNANQNGIFYQDIPINPVQEYALKASFKLETNFEGNGGQIDMGLVWLNSSGIEISRETLDVDASISTISTWEHVSLSNTSPAGAASVRVQIHWTTDSVIENSTASSAMLDNMELTTTATNAYDWCSRESGFAPQLVISSWILADGDSDGDGMRDGWEIQHFGDLSTTDGTGDFDGDTFIDQDEFIAGTDPDHPGSFFQSQISAPGTNQCIIEWESVGDRIYTVLWSPDLYTAFSKVYTGIEYPQNRVTDTVHQAELSGFYKIEVKMKEYVRTF